MAWLAQVAHDQERKERIHEIDRRIEALAVAPPGQKYPLSQALLTQFTMYLRSTGQEETDPVTKNLVNRFLLELDEDDLKTELFEIMKLRMKRREDFVPESESIDDQIIEFMDYKPKPVPGPSGRTYSVPRNSSLRHSIPRHSVLRHSVSRHSRRSRPMARSKRPRNHLINSSRNRSKRSKSRSRS